MKPEKPWPRGRETMTPQNLMYKISQIAHANGNVENKDIIEAIEGFEKEIRKDQTRICARAFEDLETGDRNACPFGIFKDGISAIMKTAEDK